MVYQVLKLNRKNLTVLLPYCLIAVGTEHIARMQAMLVAKLRKDEDVDLGNVKMNVVLSIWSGIILCFLA